MKLLKKKKLGFIGEEGIDCMPKNCWLNQLNPQHCAEHRYSMKQSLCVENQHLMCKLFYDFVVNHHHFTKLEKRGC